MNTSLYQTERQQEILSLLDQNRRVSVGDLSKEFDVSEVTIRADLQMMAKKNLLVRTHGGALPIPRPPELSLVLRRKQQVGEKIRIGEAATEYVSNGDAIFLDASSTSLAIANNLRQHRDVTVLTHSLEVAQVLLDAPGITVVMTGGVLQRETISLMGTDGLVVFKKYNICSGFFGAHGLSFPEGLTDVSAGEAEVKREIVGMCRQVIAVIDATKWGRVGPASFCAPEDLNVILSDKKAPAELVEEAIKNGARVVQV